MFEGLCEGFRDEHRGGDRASLSVLTWFDLKPLKDFLPERNRTTMWVRVLVDLRDACSRGTDAVYYVVTALLAPVRGRRKPRDLSGNHPEL